MVLSGGAMYGTMSTFVKLAYAQGYNAAEISFAQALLSALLLGTFVLLMPDKKRDLKLFSKQNLSMLFTGSIIGLTNFLYYLSVSYIPASLAIVILMQFTWFSLLLEWLLTGNRPGKAELSTVLLILVGTILAADLLSEQKLSVSGIGIALAAVSSLTYALYIIANSRLSKSIAWQPKSALIMAGSAVTIFAINARPIITSNHFGYEFMAWALFLAIVGTTIPTALFAASIPKIGTSLSSILMTIEFPVAVMCAHLLLDEHLNIIQISGIILMIGAISAMNYYKYIEAKKLK